MLDRKQQILDVAGELLQTRSYSAFSYQDLSDRLGITKASIHHHFASKEDLGIALAERFYQQAKLALGEISRKHNKPWDQLEGYFAFVGEIARSGNKICCAGILQAEQNVIPQEMRDVMGRLCQFTLSWLAKMLAEGREQGVMHFPGKTEDQATLIYTAVQGALQHSRALGPKQFTSTVRQLKAAMKANA